jgi:hypothetical protein
MQLSFCDKCGRPLSEGSVARGEATQRGSETVCAQCVSREQEIAKASARPAPNMPKPLVEYAQAVWHCEGCGIPVTALDLIEGRAARYPNGLRCLRCAPAAASPAVPAPVAAPSTPVEPAATPRPEPRLPSGRKLPVSTRKPAAGRPADEFVHQAKAEERRPVLPILLFAIVLPMFGVSLYFAITSQQKLNEAMTARGNGQDRPDRRNERPHDQLSPEAANSQPNVPANEPAGLPPTQPDNPPVKPAGPAPTPMTPEIARDLADLESQLAAPVILQLQSKDLGDVWEGLIAAGSRRLVAARPQVRALLREPDDNTRALACRVCGILSDRDALTLLDHMAENDPSEAVKVEARKAKGRLTGSATREVKDMTSDELEEYLRTLHKELERRKGRND